MKKILLGLSALACAHFSMAQLKTYDLYVVAEGNFGSPNGDVYHAARINDTTHNYSGGLFQTTNNTSAAIDVLQDYGTFGDKAVLCSKGGASSPYKLAIVAYPSFDSIKTFTGLAGVQCLGKASNTKAYLSMATGNNIQLLDLITNTITPVVNTGNQINSYASYMVSANGFMYVAIGSKIVKIDTATNAVTTSLLPNIGSIAGMQYDAVNNCIWLLGKVSGTSSIVKLEPFNNDFLNTPVALSGITNAAQLRLAVNKLYFLSGKNVYTYNIANPVLPAPLLYTSNLPGNSFSFAYGKSFDVDPNTGDFALATAGNYAQPSQFEVVDGTTFQIIDTGSVAGRIANELELHTYTTPIPNPGTITDIYASCSAILDTPAATVGNTTINATTNDPTTFNQQGNHTVTWTFQNGYSSYVQTQNIIIHDTIRPVPGIDTLPNLTVNCPYTLIQPTALDNCSGNITGTTDSLTFTIAGSYNIDWSYNDGNGNTAHQTQHITVSCPTGIDAVNERLNTFKTYPNPASGKVIVEISNPVKDAEVVITNALGQIKLRQTIKGNLNIISLNNFASGLYFVNIITKENIKGKSQKIIVQ